MIRPATLSDLSRIFEIRDSVRENQLSDPSRVTRAAALWFIDNAALWVWEEADGAVTGFAGSDPRDGSIWALFVAPGQRGRGIGRALLERACDALRRSGHQTAMLSTEPGSRAERHYRAAGWTPTGTSPRGELILQKTL